MKRLFLVGFVIASSLFSVNCSGNSLGALDQLETHFKARGCGSNGNLTLGSATVTSLPTLNGDYHFTCPQSTPTQDVVVK